MHARVVDSYRDMGISVDLLADGTVRVEDPNKLVWEDHRSIDLALSQSQLLSILDAEGNAASWLFSRWHARKKNCAPKPPRPNHFSHEPHQRHRRAMESHHSGRVIDLYFGVNVLIEVVDGGIIKLEDRAGTVREEFASAGEALQRSELLKTAMLGRSWLEKRRE